MSAVFINKGLLFNTLDFHDAQMNDDYLAQISFICCYLNISFQRGQIYINSKNVDEI